VDSGSPRGMGGLGEPPPDVVTLDVDAAVSLLDAALRAGCPDDGRITDDRGGAEWLADRCGRLPLALQIAAALLQAGPALGVGELADELGAELRHLETSGHEDRTGPGTSPIAAALGLACRRLTETAARLFRLLPVNPGPDVSTTAAAILADLQVGEAHRILAGLARVHLIEPVPGDEGRWRMNDLVRAYAEQLSDAHAEADGREQSRDRLLSYYLNLTAAADDYLRLLPGMDEPEEFTSRDSALAWLDRERDTLTAAVVMAANTSRDQAAMRLPLLLAGYLAQRRRLGDLLATTTVSLAAARRLGDQDGEGDALTNLGGVLLEMSRFEEAATAQQDAAAIFRQAGDRRGEADALNNLGLALHGLGRLDEAVTAHQDAAAIFRETGDRHAEGRALTNLGLALHGLGRLDEAAAAHQDAAAIFRETGDRHREGKALANLGDILREAGRSAQAATARQDAAVAISDTPTGAAKA
jgi:tetratricopeptide (TPR) repeat protein